MIVKIGVSKKPDIRLFNLQNAHELRIMGVLPFGSRREAYNIEKYMHQLYRRRRIRGEWFYIEPNELPELVSYEIFLQGKASAKYYVYFIQEVEIDISSIEQEEIIEEDE